MTTDSRKTKQHTKKILSIDLEPTPYKTDLWNAFFDIDYLDVFVIYTERKNWAPDGGHNYLKWPNRKYKYVILEGKGFIGRLRSSIFIISKLLKENYDLIYIAGYADIPTVTTIFFTVFMNKKFVMHADEFNNELPSGSLGLLKILYRKFIRGLVFRQSLGVLVCGKRGLDSAVLAGCRPEKIVNFPYVIDIDRIKKDLPIDKPNTCIEDLASEDTVLFFSGRMIPRKGLSLLLKALSDLSTNNKWKLWIEGDGPEMDKYQLLAEELEIDDSCRFLGFCQYDLHSWLIRSSNVVIVPSYEDTWGIIVDEGLQLGKVVITSDATGSGYDRIKNNTNGYIFRAGDNNELSRLIQTTIEDNQVRQKIINAALFESRHIKPIDNVNSLLKLNI